MKIDGILMDDVQTIENNYDNIGILKIVKYLINVVINDIEYMNNEEDFDDDEVQYLDLGNNTEIKKEDLESLVSIVDDTITNILEENK